MSPLKLIVAFTNRTVRQAKKMYFEKELKKTIKSKKLGNWSAMLQIYPNLTVKTFLNLI